MMPELTEECCFNDPRDYCKGRGCSCGCHERKAKPMHTDLTRGIETRAESAALLSAAELIADEYRDDTRGGTWTPEIQRAVRKAWIAGRDWSLSVESATRAPRDGGED